MTLPQLLKPPGLVQSPAFSHVAVIPPNATLVLVGGQNAVDENGQLVGGGDGIAQTRKALENVVTALAAAGASTTDLVSWSMLVHESVDLQAAAAAAIPFLPPGRNPPLITVAIVPRLGPPGALVEISAMAAVPTAS